MEAGHVSDGKDKSQCKKEQERKVSPLSTLESSFEVLNMKKLDVAFMVDPLYHQTSAQFDEGGAKGLLLYNLGVYGRCQDNNWHTSLEADNDDRFEEVSAFSFQGLASTSKKNAWAGPDHWKYWRPKEDAPANPCRRSNKKSYKNHTEVDLIFATSIGKEFPYIFSPPKSLKSLLLPANGVPGHRLPEDCHYPPDDLVKLFLLPNVLVIVLYALLITCGHIHENL
ncbi:hypothetical protein ACLB2K_031897 [Fragaria x ananassa]